MSVRARHDGWHAERQVALIEALAESGCVDHACRHVGMSPQSAYALRHREDAKSFRFAWDVALEYAVQRLSDAVLSRAIHGVSRPVFFQGQQIGERRHYDERLAMFILRYRDGPRYGRWLDTMEFERPPDALATRLEDELYHVMAAALAAEEGEPPPPRDYAPLSQSVPIVESFKEAAEAVRRYCEERREKEEKGLDVP